MTGLSIEPATIIRDISATMVEYHQQVQQTRSKDGALAPARQLHRIEAPHRQLIRDAIHLFGRINGWHIGPDVRSFNVGSIGKRIRRSGITSSLRPRVAASWAAASTTP